jgi:hypothetical protein
MAISDLLLMEFDEEVKKTRATLERVPSGKADFAQVGVYLRLNSEAVPATYGPSADERLGF